MARLDRFLTVLKEQAGDALTLAAGQPAALRKNGSARAVSREPLSAAQIVGLVREITPAAKQELLAGNAEFAFTYDAPSGAVEVRCNPDQAAAKAILRYLFPPGAASANGPARVDPPVAREPELDLSSHRDGVERLLRLLHQRRASDLHLRTGSPPMLRVDGDLVAIEGEEPMGAQAIELMIRSIASQRDFGTWTHDHDVDFAHEIDGIARFRCNAALDRLGPVLVSRIIPAEIRTVEDLGLSKEVQALCQLTKGLVLVTGPTGSGKSTTLAAMVDLVNRTRNDHIITIEDPIEFVHHTKKCLVTQRQVGLHTNSFKHALRAALREDPDVVLVGEMRDLETISIAIETAETGHLVFGTLHTTTAASTLDRIIDQFPADRQSQIRVMLSESLRGVIAQVLCRKTGGGRVAAQEILLSIPAISNLIREGKTFQIPSIMQTNRKVGMVTLNDALLELVQSQQVEPREAYMRSAEKTGFLAQLKAKGFPTDFLSDG